MDMEEKWAEEGKNNYFYLSLKSKVTKTCYINVFQELIWINWYCWGTSQEKKMIKRLNFPHQIF